MLQGAVAWGVGRTSHDPLNTATANSVGQEAPKWECKIEFNFTVEFPLLTPTFRCTVAQQAPEPSSQSVRKVTVSPLGPLNP